jgi:hypothetical protein
VLRRAVRSLQNREVSVRKPKEGEIIRTTDPYMINDCGSDAFKVLAVYDSLNINEPGGNWDPWGELAVAQADIDAEKGKTGEWYVVGYPVYNEAAAKEDMVREGDVWFWEGETWSLASYEVQVD